jgi:hypothetical protein
MVFVEVVMTTARLKADQGAVLNATQWLRQHLNTPDYDSVDTEFEQHFGCKIRRVSPDDFVYGKIYAEFEESEAVAFLLRWA